MIIEFPPFTPDLADLNNPGLTVGKNIMPVSNYYKSVKTLVPYSSSVPEFPRGAYAGRIASTGISINFIGTKTRLYRLGSATFSNVSKTGNYNLDASDMWFFTQYGNRIIGVSITTQPQSYVVGTSALFEDLVNASDPTDLPPKARFIASIKDFVVVGNTVDSVDGNVPNRVRWCAIGNPTSWTVSAVTQADYQDLDAQYGWVTQVVGGESATIFQERAITTMHYVGGTVVFQFDTVETNRGTRLSGSVIKVGSFIYYIGLDGFYRFNGNFSEPIGDEEVDDFFYNSINLSYDYRVNSAIDYQNNLIVWSYTSGNPDVDGTPNRKLYYNFSPKATKRWGYAEISDQFSYTAYSEGYTLDQLDDWLSANGYAISIDVLPYSLDSRFWTGNDIKIAGFSSGTDASGTAIFRLAYFEGTALTSVIETAEVQLTDAQSSDLFKVRPLVEGSAASITVQIGTRNRQSTSAVSYSSPVSLNISGDADVRAGAFYHRMRVNISGGFRKAIGFEILEFTPSGDR